MRLQILLLAKHHKDRLAWIDEYPMSDLVENPGRRVRRQVGLKTTAAGFRLVRQRTGLVGSMLPFDMVIVWYRHDHIPC